MEDLIPHHGDITVRVARWDRDIGAGSFWDACALATVVRAYRPKLCVEIGTGQGRGTAQMLANSDAEVYTFDIDAGSGRVFADMPEAARVKHIIADSTRHDFSSMRGRCDLVLIDGSHEFHDVVQDTQTAFNIVSQHGIILWHDVSPDWPGVVRALRASPSRSQIRRLFGTNYAVYAPTAPSS